MISVIIPLYNKEAIIERTLQSVLSQDYNDFEIVIVDDGSTDNSLQIVNHYLEQFKLLNHSISQSHRSVNIVRQPNGGPSKARNTGVRQAKGEWILFLDADDELCEHALKNFAKELELHPNYDMYFGRMSDAFGTDKVRAIHEYRNLYCAQAFALLGIGPGSSLFSKHFVLEYPFDERLRRNEDMDFLYRIFKKVRIYMTNDIVVFRNKEFAEASHARPTITEDYVGYIDIKGSSFWECIVKYQTFMAEWGYYPGEINRENLNYCFSRLDIKAICMIISFIRKHKLLYKFCTKVIQRIYGK